MGDNRTDLPEGTDTVIAGATNVDETPEVTADLSDLDEAEASTTESDQVNKSKLPTPRADAPESGVRQRLREGGERFSTEAGDRARGFVSQGLERSADALSNVSRLVGDTADGLEERLGAEYGDYARRAAFAIENTANSIASKDPDELMEDTRNFVRNSPGVAIAGAAIVGFVVARLFKSGLVSRNDDEA
jgi:ElaB/YqjD/DUF883 family membrane-anchored ribosome-binding protein